MIDREKYLLLRDEAALRLGRAFDRHGFRYVRVDADLVAYLCSGDVVSSTKIGAQRTWTAIRNAEVLYDFAAHEVYAPEITGVQGRGLAERVDDHLRDLTRVLARGEDALNAVEFLRLERYMSEAENGVMKVNDWWNIDRKLPRGVVRVDIANCADPRVQEFARANPKCYAALVYKPEVKSNEH